MEVGGEAGEVGDAEEGEEGVVAAGEEGELGDHGLGGDGVVEVAPHGACEGLRVQGAGGLRGVVVEAELGAVGEGAQLEEVGCCDVGGGRGGVVDVLDVDEVEDGVGFGIAQVVGRGEDVGDEVVDAAVVVARRSEHGLVLGAGHEVGRGVGHDRAEVVALDPDCVGRVLVDAVQRDILVAGQGGGDGRAVGEFLDSHLVDAVQGRIQALQERRGRVEKDALVGSARVDLSGHILKLGDALDTVRRVRGQVAGPVVGADLEQLLGTEVGEHLGAVVLGSSFKTVSTA